MTASASTSWAANDDLRPALAMALTAHFGPIEPNALTALSGRGISHDHWVFKPPAGSPKNSDGNARTLVVRVARLSQWHVSPATQLAYEATAFRRAAVSDATPRLHAILPVSPSLPWGGLIVDHISGDKPKLPQDLPALARCLGAIHRMPLPADTNRHAPLRTQSDAVGDIITAVKAQARHLDTLSLSATSVDLLRTAIQSLDDLPARVATLPPLLTLVGTDTHPGNFLMPTPDRAVFVDLEKMLYGNPAADLAHATLYTSTRWDPDINVSLTEDQLTPFLAAYQQAVPAAMAQAVIDWLPVMRRLIWLRTTTWCVQWLALAKGGQDGWSQTRLSPDHQRHIHCLIDDYLSPDRLDALSRVLTC